MTTNGGVYMCLCFIVFPINSVQHSIFRSFLTLFQESNHYLPDHLSSSLPPPFLPSTHYFHSLRPPPLFPVTLATLWNGAAWCCQRCDGLWRSQAHCQLFSFSQPLSLHHCKVCCCVLIAVLCWLLHLHIKDSKLMEVIKERCISVL